MFKNNQKILENFLGSNFHQDIESVEETIQELLKEETTEYLEKIELCINDFLKSDINIKQKDDFIEEKTYIYFPAIKKKPTEWIEELSLLIKSEISKRG